MKDLLSTPSVTFQTHENDFLAYHIFDDVTNNGGKTGKGISYAWVFITIACLSYLAYEKANHISTGTFEIVFLVLCVCSYPFFNRLNYVRHYKKFVRETYSTRFGKRYTLNFNKDFIGLADDAGEAKIMVQDVDEVFETIKHFFIKLKTNPSIIIPKNELESVDELRKELITVAGKAQAKFIYDSNWGEN